MLNMTALSSTRDAFLSGGLQNCNADEGTKCPICLEDLCSEDEQTVRIKPCKHVFGSQCLAAWLKFKNTCPMCRKVLYAGEPEVTGYGDVYVRGLLRQAREQLRDRFDDLAEGMQELVSRHRQNIGESQERMRQDDMAHDERMKKIARWNAEQKQKIIRGA
jgi:hypothetical protein